MTLNELKTEVAALGFEPGADTDPILIGAANRALSMICAELPTVKTLRVPACPYAPTYYLAELHHAADERIEISLSGKAYFFYVNGKGRYTEISDGTMVTRDFDTSFSEFRGFINGNAKLIFEGGDFTILDLSVFDKVIGDSIEGIPLLYENRIRPDDFTDDFFDFVEVPRDSSGNLIRGSRFDGREVVLPLSYRGTVMLRYESRPKRINRDTSAIDVSPAVAFLLPLLTAYFVWLDDEPKLAESYLTLYQEYMSKVRRKRAAASAEYVDALGWT